MVLYHTALLNREKLIQVLEELKNKVSSGFFVAELKTEFEPSQETFRGSSEFETIVLLKIRFPPERKKS